MTEAKKYMPKRKPLSDAELNDASAVEGEVVRAILGVSDGADASVEKTVKPEPSLRAQALEIAQNGELRDVFEILTDLFPLATTPLLDRSKQIDVIFDDPLNADQSQMTREQRNNEVNLIRTEVLEMLESVVKN